MIERYLLVWMGLLSLAAYYWPSAISVEQDPFLALDRYLSVLFATAMFCVGALLPIEEIRHVRRRWPTILGGTAIQYAAMPLLGWLATQTFALDSEAAIGVILVGCVPGAMASNVLTLVGRGNVSYSVALTTLSTLLSPIVVPLALYLTIGARNDLDPRQVAGNLTMTVVGPVVLGFLLARASAAFARSMRRFGAPFANIVILLVIATVVAKNRAILSTALGAVSVALLMVNAVGYMVGHAGGIALRLSIPMRRALTLEIGMQNAGLGAVLANQLFPSRAAIALPPALYMLMCMVTGAALARWWASRTVADGDVVGDAFG